MNKLLVALVLIAATGSAHAERMVVRTATWFADNPVARFKVNTLCKDDPGEAHRNPNCENASQGDFIAAARDAQKHTGYSVNPAVPTYWRNPANADQYAFWKRQCEQSAARHVAQDTTNLMWCPAIKAAGG